MEEEWHGYIGFSDDGETMWLWSINRLWKLSALLPVEAVPLSSLSAVLDEILTMTKREMASEAKRIMEANLDYPIIFSAHGRLMDGSHRIMKAAALGQSTIKAVRFLQDPEPDHHRTIAGLDREASYLLADQIDSG